MNGSRKCRALSAALGRSMFIMSLDMLTGWAERQSGMIGSRLCAKPTMTFKTGHVIAFMR